MLCIRTNYQMSYLNLFADDKKLKNYEHVYTTYLVIHVHCER